MREAMLTTIDNPFDPFDQFDEWLQYDETMGYRTCALLDSQSVVSHEMTDRDTAIAIEEAIDEILNDDAFGIHVKVVRDIPDPEVDD